LPFVQAICDVEQGFAVEIILADSLDYLGFALVDGDDAVFVAVAV